MKGNMPLIMTEIYNPEIKSPERLSGGINCEFSLVNFINSESKNIYDLYGSSVTTYEKRLLSNELAKIGMPLTNKNLTLKRERKYKKYYYEDNVFPLYKGLYCAREDYVGSKSKIKVVTTQELNLYENYIQLVYLYEKSGNDYNEEEVRSRYTELEYDYIIPDLLAALCLEVISSEEYDILINLLRRDPRVSLDLDHIEQLANLSEGRAVKMASPSPHNKEVIIHDVTPMEILRHQVCMYLTPLLHLIRKACFSNSDINMKAESDYRIIFEMPKSFSNLQINLETRNHKDTCIYIRVRSKNSRKVVEDLENIIKFSKEAQ